MPIILYYDDIDVCNPIGTRASVHKLGMFYMSLANIKLKFRSRLPAIRLLSITSCKIINIYGVDEILKPFYEDMLKLSEGVKFVTIDGDEILLRGALLAAVADTPASHLLGGFKEGVGGAYAKCRHCECSQEEMQEHFVDSHFQPRTAETHLEHCNEIDNAATAYMKNYIKTTYGINRKSILTDIPGFDVTQMLPQDIMHVMWEGVCPHAIKLVLNHLVDSGDIDLETFNSKIRNFAYSYFDCKDKPCEIPQIVLTSDDSRLKQSASQIMVLIKIIPFLLKEFVPSDNEYFQFLVDLPD